MDNARFATLAIAFIKEEAQKKLHELSTSPEEKAAITRWIIPYIEAHRDYLEEHAMEVIENSPELRKLYYKHSH
jgi:hypothetical protein